MVLRPRARGANVVAARKSSSRPHSLRIGAKEVEEEEEEEEEEQGSYGTVPNSAV